MAKKTPAAVKKAPPKKALKASKKQSAKKAAKKVVGHEEQLVGKLRAAKDTKTFFKLLAENPEDNQQLILSWASVAEHARTQAAQDLEPVLLQFLEHAFRKVDVPANTVPTLAHAVKEIQVQRDEHDGQGAENPDAPWSLDELEDIEEFLANLIGEHESDQPLAVFVELQ